MRSARGSCAARLVLAAVLGGAIAFGAIGCSQDSRRSEASTQPQQVDPRQSPRAGLASLEVRQLEVIESAQDGRVLVGRALPAPPQSSARLLFEPVLFDERGREAALPPVGRLQDARFAPLPSKLLALLDEHEILWLWDGSSPGAEQVDTGVFPGFDFSHASDMLVYSKGVEPELDAWRLDLATRSRTQLTHDQEPVWGFAFSPDDKRIVYVGSQGGFPSLFTMGLDGTARARLTNRGVSDASVLDETTLAPIPDGRRPPVWGAGAIYVENAAGVHAIDAQGRVVWSLPGAGQLHRGTVRDSILLRDGERLMRVP